MNDSYLIQEGDTLSVLAERFATDTATLQRLNSEQIKNIDLIIEGNRLKLPKQIDNAGLDHSPVTQPSTKLLTQTQCAYVEYTDVMYFPEHHETKKPTWLALTKDAVDLIKKEDALCRSKIVPDDKEATIKGLSELGIMDQFNSVLHEYFLSKGEISEYRQTLLDLLALVRMLDENKLWVPEAYQLSKSQMRRRLHEYQYEDCVSPNAFVEPICPVELEHYTKSMKARIYHKAFRHHQLDVKEKLEQKVKQFEDKAKANAKKTQFKENNVTLKFSYYPKGNFYTSNTDLKRYTKLQYLIKHRKNLVPNEYQKKNKLTAATKLYKVEKTYKWYQRMAKDYEVFKHFQEEEWKLRTKMVNQQRRTGSELHFFVALYALNQCGVIIKEQALTEAQLFKHHEAVDKLDFSKYEEKKNYQAIMTTPYEELGYHCAKKVYLASLQEAAVRLKDFSALVGTNINSQQSYVGDLLAISLRAYSRITALKEIAESNLTKKTLSLHFKAASPLHYADNEVPFIIPVEKDQLVWDELDWQPSNKAQHFFADPGNNNTRIVEGYLNSNDNKVSFCRNTCDVISTSLKNCSHAVEIKPYTASVKTYENIKLGGVTFKSASAETQLTKKFAEHNSALSKKYGFYWRVDSKECDFIPATALEVGAQAQFFRFSTGQEIGNTLSSDQQHLKLGNHKFEASFDAVRGTLGARLSYPNSPNGGKIEIPYYIEQDGKVSKQQFDIGHYKISIAFNVGGAVGVSVSLGTEIQVGPVETSSGRAGLGIRGTVPNLADLPAYSTTSSNGRLPTYQQNADGSRTANYAVGASTQAKAFAGVKCGGSVNFDFQWRPPITNLHSNNNQTFRSLIAAGASAEATAGIGGEYKLQIAYRDGKFIMLTSLQGTFGFGIGGKVGLEISPLVLDDIIFQLLQITKLNGFRRIAFISSDKDESVESDTFYAINKVLTLMLTFQLKASQIMLLPFGMLDQLSTEAKLEKNAPLLANYLTDEKVIKSGEVQKWIEVMYPETLAAILKVLTHFHDTNYFVGLSEEDQQKNSKQCQAIVNILKWVSLNPIKPSENDRRQFEEAMQRLTLEPNEALDKAKQWDYYAKGLSQLRAFFLKSIKTTENAETLSDVTDVYELFIIQIKALGQNVFVYHLNETKSIDAYYFDFKWEEINIRAYYKTAHQHTQEFKQLKNIKRVPWTIGKVI